MASAFNITGRKQQPVVAPPTAPSSTAEPEATEPTTLLDGGAVGTEHDDHIKTEAIQTALSSLEDETVEEILDSAGVAQDPAVKLEVYVFAVAFSSVISLTDLVIIGCADRTS